MEAASHGNPRRFQVAVTVVLEQLKREELKRKTRNQRNEAYFCFFLQAFCFPPLCNLK
jgi:F0F1-type ATP synthase membrane subunit a